MWLLWKKTNMAEYDMRKRPVCSEACLHFQTSHRSSTLLLLQTLPHREFTYTKPKAIPSYSTIWQELPLWKISMLSERSHFNLSSVFLGYKSYQRPTQKHCDIMLNRNDILLSSNVLHQIVEGENRSMP